MVTERTQEDKSTKQAKGSRTVSVALSGEHAERLTRVARAYELEPDELVTYLLMREELPLHGTCVQCSAAVDRVDILNRRITAQRRELGRLNHAIARGAFGRSKIVEGRALAAMASLDRVLSFFAATAQEETNPDYLWHTVAATRRVLAHFINGRFPAWGQLTSFGRRHAPEDVLPKQSTIEW